MKLKNVFFSVLFVLSINSEAQLRCFNLFTTEEIGTSKYYATVMDALNEKYNNFLFNENFAEKLENNFENKSFTAQTKARYQTFKLRRALKTLKSVGAWDRYDFDNFSRRLEQLTFLTDLSLLKDMSRQDKILYSQARHSLISKGLEEFLFSGSKAPESVKKKAFNWFMVGLNEVSRWSFALLYMPKLDGSLMPIDVAAKIAWEGLDNNRQLLEPYKKHSQFKSYFNIFSSTYNWAVVGAIFIALPAYGYLTFKDLQETGNQQAAALFTPLLAHAEQMAKTDYHQTALTMETEHFKEEVQLQLGREPDEREMAIFKKSRGL